MPGLFGKQRKKSILDEFGPCWTILDDFDVDGVVPELETVTV